MRNATLCLVVLALFCAPVFGGALDLAKSSGVQGGIIVHVGCGDGAETARLMLDQRYLVHGLDASAANVATARKTIMAAGLYGKVSVCTFDGKTLPYTNDLVNLVIDSTGTVPRAEIMRVLVPGGVAFIDGKKVVKPRSADIGEWNHFLNGADNNAVTADKRVDIPRSIQWVSEPKWGRSHEEMASMSATVSANGRVFFIVDESPLASIRFLGKWSLVARDAFNGTLLWKRPIKQWNDHLRHFRSGPTHLPRRLVAVGDTVYVTEGLAGPVLAIDGATGETIRQYKGTERTEEILVDNGVLYLVVGTSESGPPRWRAI
jgi:outer membrane protein assembly factor BamB